jgi:hypothetical protein
VPLTASRLAIAFRSVNRAGRPGHDAGLQRHHLLPLQVLSSRPLGKVIARLGADRLGMHDFRRNGLLLPSREDSARRIGMPLHRGPHRTYNELVLERSGQIEAGWARDRLRDSDVADAEALMRFDLLQRALRRRLLDPARWVRMPLNRRDPALDFSHLDAMAEALWGATE